MRKPSTSRESQIFDAAIGGIGRLLGWVVGRTSHTGLNHQRLAQRVRDRLGRIDELMRLGGPSQLKQALIEADKLLDTVLGELGYQGKLADKLSKAQSRLSPAVYQAAWAGHKLRNQLVHESGELLDHQLKGAVDQIKVAIKELIR